VFGRKKESGMKRWLIVFAFLLVASSAFALDSSDLWYTYEINNTSGSYVTTLIPTTSIRPNVDKIVGWTIQGLSLSSENFIAVYDADSNGLHGECLGESESLPESVDGRWFTTPRKITTGVAVRQGPNTKVFVYFTSY
jgi:hypothetical protein